MAIGSAIASAVGAILQTTANVIATEVSIGEQWDRVNAQIEGRDYTGGTAWPQVIQALGGGLGQLSSVVGRAYDQRAQKAHDQDIIDRTARTTVGTLLNVSGGGGGGGAGGGGQSIPPARLPEPRPSEHVVLPKISVPNDEAPGITLPPGSILNYHEAEPIPVPAPVHKPPVAPTPVPAAPAPVQGSDLISSEDQSYTPSPDQYASLSPSALNVSK